MVATERALREAIGRYYDRIEDLDVARHLGLDPNAAGDVAMREAERLALEAPVVRIIHTVIAEAIARRASDIHFRPGEHALDLLYRIDDDMVPVRRFLRALAPALVSRIKVLGLMNLAEHRTPQDGRTTFTLDDGRTVDLRVSRPVLIAVKRGAGAGFDRNQFDGGDPRVRCCHPTQASPPCRPDCSSSAPPIP